MKTLMTSVMAGLLLPFTIALAEVSIRQEPVQFEKGATSATIKGSIKGDQTVDYQVRAGAGQTMVVDFKPSHPSAYFNVTAPDSVTAMFVGSTSGNHFDADLPADGVYTIRVYLMRSASRRNESASYTLEVAVAGPAKASSAGAAGPTAWDASGSVRCSVGRATLDGQCGFRVVRDLARRAADIWVVNAAQDETEYRLLHYENEAFTTNDGAQLAWQRQDDNWLVSVDDREFYLIPDALIHGG